MQGVQTGVARKNWVEFTRKIAVIGAGSEKTNTDNKKKFAIKPEKNRAGRKSLQTLVMTSAMPLVSSWRRGLLLSPNHPLV